MSPTRAWLLATRPKTLWAAGAPVLMGTAMAWDAAALHWPSALCALLGAMLIQIGTNFANDYFDFVKGTDTEERIGPTRATQAGLVTPAAMRNATILIFALSLLPGAYIMWRGGWPFVVIGALSILFGILYTGGPKPLGYLGLGDILVLIFFGPVAVGGTYYLQALSLPPEPIIAGLAPGFISVALLTVNNLRDIDGDRVAGKKTLAVRFGAAFAKAEYLVSLITACVVVPLILYARTGKLLMLLLGVLTMYIGVYCIRIVYTYEKPAALNGVLARTGALLLLYSVFFAIAWTVKR